MKLILVNDDGVVLDTVEDITHEELTEATSKALVALSLVEGLQIPSADHEGGCWYSDAELNGYPTDEAV